MSYYTGGMVPIAFPEDDICCRWCPLLGTELKVDRNYCKKTGEYLVAPNFIIGANCPIIFDALEE